MRGHNRVTVMGNLGQDPEVRYTQSGAAVANVRLAVSERRKDAAGEWRDHVEWVAVVLWGKTAEAIGQYASKGSGLLVEGRLQTREYKTKDGDERRATEVVGERAILVGGGGQRDASRGSRPAGKASADDELPF